MASSKKCGPHTELASNDATRVTRCGCGTVHITLLGPGVTVRMSAEAFRGVTSGLKAAAERLDDDPRFGTTSIN
ncbi:hypothetical protein SOCE26_096840 [Sorangium cellulosum]|uniref:Uncharacterized protein n=1 Tax=Sorangium cellulosum TaxID=56 RepID=A0A2L0F9A7_SORCE|nr:hypothetical protein [Sorangium cellulosum]AUX48154.1 hypothetical protein SOCE26_096840 [Sorangium cellulosum]